MEPGALPWLDLGAGIVPTRSQNRCEVRQKFDIDSNLPSALVSVKGSRNVTASLLGTQRESPVWTTLLVTG